MNALMKKILLPGLLVLLCMGQANAAQEVSVDVDTGAGGQPVPGGGALEKILQYLKNWGLHIGFDITKPPQKKVQSQIIDAHNKDVNRLDMSNLVNSYLGAIPATISEKTQEDSLVPSILPVAKSINTAANGTILAYSTPKKGDVTVNELLDQKQFQQDPVSQAVLNILTTPDTSWCMDEKGNILSEADGCPRLFRSKIVNNVLGPDIPVRFYAYDWNQAVLNQLNSNSLMTPLMYSVKPTTAPGGGQKNAQNLTATTQAEEAANFVRYAISDVLPLQLIAREDYVKLYRQYINANKTNASKDDIQGKIILENYLTSLRVYAAQRSVAIGNLYDIMSRRMVQAPSSDSGEEEPTSEALSEFTMAAWRLKNIGDGKSNGPSQEWIKKINEASSDTVQKEMALLLAEMNYQMYLNRQQQERLLLTETMILIENMKGNAPSIREIRENFAINQAQGTLQKGAP